MKNVIFVLVQKIVNVLVAKMYLKDKNVMFVKKNTFGKKKLQHVLKHVLMANLVKLAHVNVKSAIKIVKHALDQKRIIVKIARLVTFKLGHHVSNAQKHVQVHSELPNI